MNVKFIALGCLLFLGTAFAQQTQAPKSVNAKAADVQVLDAKIHQAWEDYKNKNKAGFTKILTDDVVEVEADGNGARDKNAELVEMDEINLTTYALSDFHYRGIGTDGMLVRYNVEYTAMPASGALHGKSTIGEVWEKKGGDWKLVYFQETPIK